MFDFLKSPGSVEIELEKMSFSRGDTVRGKVKLKLDEPKDAEGMRLRIWGEKKAPHTDSRGRRTTRTENIYEFKVDLDGPRMYTAGEQVWDFELKIPEATQQDQLGESLAGQVAMGVVMAQQMMDGKAGMNQMSQPPRWYLEANLDIPKGRDPSKRVQLNVA